MSHEDLVNEYLAGPDKLRAAVEGMSEQQLDATPIPGKWSTRQVICHIADFEAVYVDRMKRGLAEERPTIFAGEPPLFAAALAYNIRVVEQEIQMIALLRRHMATILRTLDANQFHREVVHSVEGTMTVETLLQRITNHIPHHVCFIDEKRAAMFGNGDHS